RARFGLSTISYPCLNATLGHRSLRHRVSPRLAFLFFRHWTPMEKKRSDVMGSVYLSHAESLKLKAILSTALTSSDNVPFCGHAPAYVIVQMDGGKSVSFVSVCGLCKTWCGATGDLRVLDDAQLMPFLTKALPLPSAFSKVQELPHLFDLDSKKSFLELPSQS
ncbi:MAG: hypothetical protein ACKV19_24610, partial [Verrucomicrobiales bacterium]